MLLGALDQTVVAATLPAIVQELEIPLNRLDEVAWAITVYLAGYALILPLAGQIADRTRQLHRFLLLCLGTFALGSLIVAIGQSLGVIVLGRFVQAVGAGALLPVALGRVANDGDVRALVLRVGWVTAVAEAGAVLGPVYGAGIVEHVSWRWVFFINLPLVAMLAWWLWRAPARISTEHIGRGLDWPGALLLGGALGALTLGLARESGGLLAGYGRAALLVSGGILLLLCLRVERQAQAPFAPPALWRSRPTTAVLATHLLAGAALMVPLLVVPIWATTLLALPPAEAALLLARLTLTIPLGAVLGSLISARLPPSLIAAAGLALTTLAALLMHNWPIEATPGEMTAALLLAGFGFGLMIPPTNAIAINAAGSANAATMASLVQVARLFGMTLASTAVATWGLDHFAALTAAIPLTDPGHYLTSVRASAHEAFRALFVWGAISAAAASAAALLSWPQSEPRP